MNEREQIRVGRNDGQSTPDAGGSHCYEHENETANELDQYWLYDGMPSHDYLPLKGCGVCSPVRVENTSIKSGPPIPD